MTEIQNKKNSNFITQYWWTILIVIGAGIFLYFFFVKAKNSPEKLTTTADTTQKHVSLDSDQQTVGFDDKKLSTLAPDKKAAFLLMNDLIGDMRGLQAAYVNELNSVGWDKILDIERIKGDRGFLKSNMILDQANKIIASYRIKYDGVVDGMKNSIQTSTMSDEAKKSYMKDFQTTIAGPGKDSLWIMESQIVATMKEIFTLLKQREGQWSVQESSIIFNNSTDQEHFQEYLVKIQSIGIKEEERRKYLSAKAVEEINKLK